MSVHRQRVEAFDVKFDAWPQFQFMCHNAEVNGDIKAHLWVVSEKDSGFKVTMDSYSSPDEATEAARLYLMRNKRYVSYGNYILNYHERKR